VEPDALAEPGGLVEGVVRPGRVVDVVVEVAVRDRSAGTTTGPLSSCCGIKRSPRSAATPMSTTPTAAVASR
jgi:hypothetical protein